MASTATVPSPETPDGSNSIARVFGVLFNPKKTFESIARRPTWIVPVILLCIVGTLVVGVYGHRAGWRGLIEKQLANNSRFQELSAADQERNIEIALKIASRVAYAEVIIGPFLGAALFAGIFWLIFNMAIGAKINFHTCLAVVAYGLVPGIVGSLLGVLILFLKDPSTVDLQHLVASNAGAFISSDSPKWLLALLSSADVFLFWEMILLAVGFSAAAPKKVSFGKAFACILGLWLFVVLIRVGLAAV
jgi:Yip1 domain